MSTDPADEQLSLTGAPTPAASRLLKDLQRSFGDQLRHDALELARRDKMRVAGDPAEVPEVTEQHVRCAHRALLPAQGDRWAVIGKVITALGSVLTAAAIAQLSGYQLPVLTLTIVLSAGACATALGAYLTHRRAR